MKTKPIFGWCFSKYGGWSINLKYCTQVNSDVFNGSQPIIPRLFYPTGFMGNVRGRHLSYVIKSGRWY